MGQPHSQSLGVYETLRGWGERLQTRDLDDLRDELLVKSRADNRVWICLISLTNQMLDGSGADVEEVMDYLDLAGEFLNGAVDIAVIYRWYDGDEWHEDAPRTLRVNVGGFLDSPPLNLRTILPRIHMEWDETDNDWYYDLWCAEIVDPTWGGFFPIGSQFMDLCWRSSNLDPEEEEYVLDFGVTQYTTGNSLGMLTAPFSLLGL